MEESCSTITVVMERTDARTVEMAKYDKLVFSLCYRYYNLSNTVFKFPGIIVGLSPNLPLGCPWIIVEVSVENYCNVVIVL